MLQLMTMMMMMMKMAVDVDANDKDVNHGDNDVFKNSDIYEGETEVEDCHTQIILIDSDEDGNHEDNDEFKTMMSMKERLK